MYAMKADDLERKLQIWTEKPIWTVEWGAGIAQSV